MPRPAPADRRALRRKKQTGSKPAKTQRDETTKELFEQPAWAKNEVTMEKVISVSASAGERGQAGERV